MAQGSSVSNDRVMETLQAAFQKGDFYEAHQIYKSLNFRLQKQKKYQELASLLYSGSLEFFHRKIVHSGIELSRLFAESLEKGNIPVSEDIIRKIATLYQEIPATPESERSIYLNQIKVWSLNNNPETKAGHVALHSAIGRIMIDEGNFESAVYHYVRALDVANCVSTLRLVQESAGDMRTPAPDDVRGDGNVCESQEPDQRLLGMAVLEFLALQRIDLANQLFVDYISQHPNPDVRSKCYNFRVLALISALLSFCSRTKVATTEEFSQLQSAITELYSENHRVEKILTSIGTNYLGIQPAAPGGALQGLFAGLFKKEAPAAGTGGDGAPKSSTNLETDLDFD